MDYQSFLAQKKITFDHHGIDVDIQNINPVLFSFQRDIVKWSLSLGKAALFEDCGLGKTMQQIEWAQKIYEATNQNVLILAPLAVNYQSQNEAAKLGIKLNIAKNQSEIKSGLNITNYERLDGFNAQDFAGVVLDESSILKSFMSKTKIKLLDKFLHTKYKLCCTATPAPNDHMELGNHAEFLNVMPSNEMLARWFINDTMHFGSYRLKGHAVKSFWGWVSSWAVCIQRPSDLGYPDDGFILPSLNIEKVIIDVDITQNSGGNLYRRVLTSATNLHKEMRLTAPLRAKKAAKLVNGNQKTWIVWCNTNYEADELKRLIPDAVEVRGNEKIEIKEQKLLAFTRGDYRVIITKPSIAGWGLNWQHCHNVVFVGLNYSYELLYQAIRRSWRFGQIHPVNVFLIIAETEGNIYQTIKEKMAAHEEMQANMYKVNFKKHREERKVLTVETKERIIENHKWKLVNSDSVEYIKKLPDKHIHFSIFSPPFSGLYIYSDSIRDMGNCADDEEFFQHFSYLVPQLYRVTKPGRLCAVHCKNLVNYKGRDGKAGLRDFRGDIIREFLKHDWTYHSEVVIWKDPVIEMQRTKAHGLLYKQLRKDSSFCRQGLPEYLLLFRRWAEEGEDIEPVQSGHGGNDPKYDEYIGELQDPNIDQTNPHYFAIQVWQRYASPIWMDIRQTNVLNVQAAREDKDEKHICPLQLDIIERALELWTNPGDLVLDPFSGIGSTGYVALKKDRRYLGIELKEAYHEQAIRNLKNIEQSSRQLALFGAESIDNTGRK